MPHHKQPEGQCRGERAALDLALRQQAGAPLPGDTPRQTLLPEGGQERLSPKLLWGVPRRADIYQEMQGKQGYPFNTVKTVGTGGTAEERWLSYTFCGGNVCHFLSQ